MTTVAQVMKELEKKGNPARVRVFAKHGAPAEKLFGVSVADMKEIAKKVKGQQQLAYDLFDTGNGDAMYLAGMVADGSQMTKKRFDAWAKAASWLMIAEYSIPRVVVESKHARDLAKKWMKARKDSVASCGWSTYAGYVTVTSDEDLNLGEIRDLLKQVEEQIDQAPNRVRYTMNGFVIAVGSFVKPLIKAATATAKKLGKVDVELGGTSCKVPIATEAIQKAVESGRAGKKRRALKC